MGWDRDVPVGLAKDLRSRSVCREPTPRQDSRSGNSSKEPPTKTNGTLVHPPNKEDNTNSAVEAPQKRKETMPAWPYEERSVKDTAGVWPASSTREKEKRNQDEGTKEEMTQTTRQRKASKLVCRHISVVHKSAANRLSGHLVHQAVAVANI